MSNWARRLRPLVAVFVVLFAIAVALAFRRRVPTPSPATVNRTDPNAVVESSGGRTIRFNKAREDVSIEYQQQLTYADGSTKLVGVRVVTDERNGNRTFTALGNEGR